MKEVDFKMQLNPVASKSHFNENAKVKDCFGVCSSSQQKVEKHLDIKVPCRNTPVWIRPKSEKIFKRENLLNVANGKIPIGILKDDAIIKNEGDRKRIMNVLKTIEAKKYDNTDPEQQVDSWGAPLVDSVSLDQHFKTDVNPIVKTISDPLKNRLVENLKNLGFKVEDLVDPKTGYKYPAGVLRKIKVSSKSSVLHVDDFIRDGLKKPDFRLPDVLKGKSYTQISFNILLDDGGYQADPLYCFNKYYNPCDEKFCMQNGWQFPTWLMDNVDMYKYQPKVGEGYVFSTTAYHDIFGGSELANRITWSMFAIHVPSLNLLLIYN